MGETNGVSGSGNNFQVSGFWKKPSLQIAKTEQASSAPIKLTSDNIKREELGLINPYNSFDIDTSGMKEILDKSHKIMKDLGFPDYKLSTKAVTSTAKNVNEIILPSINLADDHAVEARIAKKDGPYADLFA